MGRLKSRNDWQQTPSAFTEGVFYYRDLNMKSTKINQLTREYAAYKGMIDEIIMKCRLLQSKLVGMKEEKEPIIQELAEEVCNKITKYDNDLNKYKKKMNIINQEIKEYYGINEL